MRFAVFLGVLSVGMAGLWLAKDRSASTLMRDGLAHYRLDDLVAFRSLRILDLEHVEVEGARLIDPLTGRDVAHIDLVTISMSSRWLEGGDFEIRGITGQGGRALIDWDNGELIVARAIAQLVTRIIEALPPDGSGRVPPLVFEDLEVVVHGEGWPLERFERSTVTIGKKLHDVEVDIDLGGGGGSVQLLFGDGGLASVIVDDLRFRPVLSQFDPTLGEFIGRTLRPRGILDLQISLGEGPARVENGTLREAYLDTTVVPFPLGPATIPFSYLDGEVDIENAIIGFEGGSVVVSAFGPPDNFTLTLDVDRARFREEFIQLVPAYRELDLVSCEDGGSYELHLTLTVVDGEIDSNVTGRGGFLIDRMRLDPPGLDIEQVVGRFEINGNRLTYPSISARCADGGLSADGWLDMELGRFDLNLRVEDVDIGKVHGAIRSAMYAKSEAQHSIAGWLQGEIECRGEFADLGRTITGVGQLSVRAGDLWDTPLIENILLALPDTDGPRGRHRVEADFDIQQGQIFIDPIRIESDLFTLRGGGAIDRNGRLDLDLVPIAVPLGWFGRIVETIQQKFLINLAVSGTIDEPVVRAIPMDVVTGPLTRAFSYLMGPDEEAEEGADPP